MQPENSSVCDVREVLKYQDSKFLHYSELIMLILSFIALPILILAIVKCIKSSLFHTNIRLITGFHCFFILIHCFGRILQHSSDMYLWMAPLAVCEKRQYFEICVISRSMYLYGIYSSSFTTVFMAIERTLATYLSHKYEHKNSCVGILLVCFQIIISLLITVPLFLDSKFTTRPDFCEFHDPSDWLLVVEIFTIFSNFVAFLQCWKLYRVNTKLRVHSKVRRLSQKYQIEENKMLIKVILRFTCLDFVFMMVYCFGNLATNFIDFSLSQGKLHGFIEMVHCLPVYAIVVTYSMARVIKHIQKRKTSNLVAEIRIREDAYFSYINNQWTRDTKNKSHK